MKNDLPLLKISIAIARICPERLKLCKKHTQKKRYLLFHISRFFEKFLVFHLTTRPLFMGWGRCVVWHFVPWKRPSRLFALTFYFPYLTFTFWLHVFWNIFSILHLGSFSFYISAPFQELRPLCGSAFCTIELPPSWRSIVGEKIEEKSSVDFLKSFFPSLIAGRTK